MIKGMKFVSSVTVQDPGRVSSRCDVGKVMGLDRESCFQDTRRTSGKHGRSTL